MPPALPRISILGYVALALVCSSLNVSAQDSPENDFPAKPSAGKMTFSSTCSGCHGLDGHGSDRAPSLATSAKVKRLSNAGLADVISNGIPNTGMPGFHSLSADQVRAVVVYLRTLQGAVETQKVSGNPERGKQVFIGKGACSSCHAMAGEGGFIGPDLTAYASTKSANVIRSAIVSPSTAASPGYRSATITTRDGEHVSGVIRNEDNFSLQLQAKDGSYHFFQRSDLERAEYLDGSSMPADYGQRLSGHEIDDLVSYLMASPAKPAADSEQKSRKPQR